MHVVLTYRATGALTLNVPALTGMDPAEVAVAAYVVSHTPPTNHYGTPGAAAIAAAYFARPSSGSRLSPMTVGDLVHAGGVVAELTGERDGPQDAWGRMTPEFTIVEDHRPQTLTLAAAVPPPDLVAYVEDNRDRLWTGKGAGVWRCLTDPPRRTVPQNWATVWELHGPLVPLLPVGESPAVVDDSTGWPGPAARHAYPAVAAP
jgi:hypothetical protein